jgi:hypothetical protein
MAHVHILIQSKFDLITVKPLVRPEVLSRPDIVAAIKRGVTFVTIFQGADGKWNKGQPVYIVKINGTEFIRPLTIGDLSTTSTISLSFETASTQQ